MKTKNKHTPGPWKFNINKTALLALNENNEHEFIYNASPYRSIEPNNANATLITAAPEMFLALKNALESLKYSVMVLQAPEKSTIRETITEIESVLKKARGE